MAKSLRLFLIFLMLGLLLGLLVVPAGATNPLQDCGFTIPCPTDTPSGGGGGGGTNPTETPVAGAATATSAVPTDGPPAPTPPGGYLPTAEPCSLAPTVTSFTSNLNVRGGPGTDYPSVYQMIYFEVRPIVGRYQYGDWWQIQLFDGNTGWVKDSVVLVSGYTAAVPIVPVPELNGATPTPGPVWEPTPIVACSDVVLPTATNTPAPDSTAVTPTNTATATATPVAEEADEEVAAADTAVPATDTPTSVAPTATATPVATAALPPGEDDSSAGGSSNGLLMGGALMIGLGVVGFFLLGRRRSENSAEA
ncbi:MAG: SH3 domain-containing protein, partial [Anaerolineales bacterium]|nr:SH3 domain-containing protein [Anaerolineales bacterium]